MNPLANPRRYRTLFLSDIHLGTRACQAESLLSFLRQHEADTIYLVGDIVDFWRVKRGPCWPQSHNDVVQKLLRMVRKGARMVFVPGNHDEALRSSCQRMMLNSPVAVSASTVQLSTQSPQLR